MKSFRVIVGIAALAAVTSFATEIITTSLYKNSARVEVETIVRNYLSNHSEDAQRLVRDYIANHPEDVQRIVKDYLPKDPEVIQQAITELVKKWQPSARNNPGIDQSAAIKSNAELLFSSPRHVTLGNPNGDVTLVEFFDYNCGFCKRALADTLTLIKDDSNLKIVLKELPILGPGSVEAARVGVAVRIQDPGGQKYLAFHQKLLSQPVPANKESALAAAKSVGVDMDRLQTDMANDEIGQTLTENVKLAQALKINGTPGYVVGDIIISGAVGAAALKDRIQFARDHAAK